MSDAVSPNNTCITADGTNPNEILAENGLEQNTARLASMGATFEQSADMEPQTPLGDARFWLAAIAESSDDAIVGKNLNGIVVSWNKAAELMFGYTADEMVGRPITQIIPPELIDQEAMILARVRRNEKIVHFETERRRKDGSLFPVSLTISPIRDNQNRVVGVSKIVRDVSERDRREEKLRAMNAELARMARHLVRARDKAESANRAKSHFLAGMSHELRTPLNGILGYAQLLQIDGHLNAVQAAQVQAMQTAGKHLLEMINCALDLSEIESGRVEVASVECDIHAIASACADIVRPVAQAKGLALTIAVTPGTPLRLISDPMRLRQVLCNLLGNAAKFTSQGAIELRLRTMTEGSVLRIEVTDTGPGITANQRPRLFQDFERLDPTGTVEGAGLGLALSARLTALIGGRLGHDDNPGGGSVFWLELPLDTGAGSMPAKTPGVPLAIIPLAPAMATSPFLDVLVVDDVKLNRDIALAFLRAAGHTAHCVESGAEAVAAAENADFDVILMDVRMPGMDGLEATRRIRALAGERGKVPIVALTAHAFAEQVEECRKAGMNEHVAKPYDQAMLLAAIAGAARPKLVLREKLSPASTPLASPITVIGAEWPVFDLPAFERTVGFLSAEAVVTYLQTISKDGEALLRDLRKTGTEGLRTGEELADAVHRLAGSAGMFGFARVAALGRQYERAIQSAAADKPILADAFRAAIEATRLTIRDRLTQTVET